MSVGAWIGVGVAVLVVIAVIAIVAWYINCYNTFIRLKNNYEEAFSTMDVQMQKRYDLIPNLVETVKGYAKHEKETLSAVIEARNLAKSAVGVEDKAKAEAAFSGSIRNLFAIAENYPELKANTNFNNLQDELAETEDKIAYARQFYNDTVLKYNNKCQQFPSSIIAGMFNFKEAESFEARDEVKSVPKVEF